MDNYSTAVDLLIQDEVKGNPHHERVLLLGDTPPVLITAAGFPDIPMAIKSMVIGKACFDHGIGTNLLKRLPQVINDPGHIFRSANESATNTVVLLTLEIHNSWPIVIPIKKNQQVGRSSAYNLVLSIYGKEGPDPVTKWTQDGLLLWAKS